jgi:3-oxoadipate enol-lactonase
MPSQPVNDFAMHYEERGRGTAVVLVHGFPLDSSMWKGQIDELSRRYRVIAPDLRGFGKSASDAPFTIASLADDVRTLAGRIGALPCVLAGLSMGGYVALSLARRYPDDLLGLALLDTRAEPDTPEGRQARDRAVITVREHGVAAIGEALLPKLIAAETARSRPHIARELRRMMEAQTSKVVEYALVAMRDRDDATPWLPDITVPTLVLVGEHDAITPPDASEAMRRVLRDSTLEVIPDAGHMSPMERPTEVNALLDRFIDGVSRPR